MKTSKKKNNNNTEKFLNLSKYKKTAQNLT